jgi:hypothetical protein
VLSDDQRSFNEFVLSFHVQCSSIAMMKTAAAAVKVTETDPFLKL